MSPKLGRNKSSAVASSATGNPSEVKASPHQSQEGTKSPRTPRMKEVFSTKKPVKRSQSRLQSQESSNRQPTKLASASNGLEDQDKKECTKESAEYSEQAPTLINPELNTVNQTATVKPKAHVEDTVFSAAAAVEIMHHEVAVGG